MTLLMISHVESSAGSQVLAVGNFAARSETNPSLWPPIIIIIILPEIKYSMVLLVTSDKEEVNVDNEVVECSMLLKTMLEGYRGPVQPKIPLPDVSSKVLKKVTEYCKYHKNDACPAARDQDEPHRPTDISEWDQKSITADQDMLFEIILAANYLQITSLFDFGCQTVVNRTKGKTPEELCNFFGIANEFTAEAKEHRS